MNESYIVTFALVISIILIVVIYNVSTKTKHNSELDRFTNKIPVVTGIFVALGVYLTYSVLKMNIQQLKLTTTLNLVDRGWLKISNQLVEMHSLCPNLIDSFMYPWQKNPLGINYQNNDSNKKDDWAAANNIATIIFSAWEDLITTSQFDTSDSVTWVRSFLQFAKSSPDCI